MAKKIKTLAQQIADIQPQPIEILLKPAKKIAILGTTPHRLEAPINDPTWHIITIGPGGKDTHRWDRLLEAHSVWPEDFKGYLNDLSLVKAPQQVLSLAPMPDLIQRWAMTHGKSPEQLKADITGDWSANVVYPRETILQKYGRRMWFSSSIAWLIPLAIEEGATDIGLWGIDLESGEEYVSQFVGCAHFIDLAILAGVNVHLPNGCGLLRDPAPYPDRYETNMALTLERKKKYIESILGQAEPEYEGTRVEMSRKEGELLTLRRLSVPAEDIGKCEQELMGFNSRMGQLAANINHLKGEQAAINYLYQRYVVGMNDPS